MKREVDIRAIQGILYGVYKSLHRIAGSSAPAVMRQAAPDILAEFEKLGIAMSGDDTIEALTSKLSETMKDTGMCDELSLWQEGDRLKADISNCAFHDLSNHLKEDGVPTFGCPFAAITLGVAETNLEKKGRIIGVSPKPGGSPGDAHLEVKLY